MKTELSKIAQDLEQGTITEKEARTLLLVLLGVSVSYCIENNEFEHYMDIDAIGYCHRCGSRKKYER